MLVRRILAAGVVFAALLMLGLPAARADETIRLRDGSSLRGRVTKTVSSGIRLAIDRGIELELPWRYLDPVQAKDYRVKLITDDGDANQHFAYAMWLRRHGLEAEALAKLNEIVKRFDKGLYQYAPAHRELGDVKFEGRWMPLKDKLAILSRRADSRTPATPSPGANQPGPAVNRPDGPGPNQGPGPGPSPAPRKGPIAVRIVVSQEVERDEVMQKNGDAPSVKIAEELAEYLRGYDFKIVTKSAEADYIIRGEAKLDLTNHSKFFEVTVFAKYTGKISLSISDTSDAARSAKRDAEASAQRNDAAGAMDATLKALAQNVGPKLVSFCR